MKRLMMLAGAFALASCSAIPGYEAYKVAASGLVDQTIKDRQEWNDAKAEVVRALNCDMSLGAYSRMPDGDVKAGVGLICGIKPVTVPPVLVVTDSSNGPDIRLMGGTPQPTGTDAMQPGFLPVAPN